MARTTIRIDSGPLFELIARRGLTHLLGRDLDFDTDELEAMCKQCAEIHSHEPEEMQRALAVYNLIHLAGLHVPPETQGRQVAAEIQGEQLLIEMRRWRREWRIGAAILLLAILLALIWMWRSPRPLAGPTKRVVAHELRPYTYQPPWVQRVRYVPVRWLMPLAQNGRGQFQSLIIRLQQAGTTLASVNAGQLQLNCDGASMSCTWNAATNTFTFASLGGGGGGTTIQVNGLGLAAATGNLNDTTPAAPANSINTKWQKDALGPTNISSYVPFAAPLGVSGGNLTCSTCEVTTNKNAANGYAGLDAGARIAKAQGHSATVYNDQSNTYAGANTQDMSGITALKLPSAASPTPTVGGDVRYDSTQQMYVNGGNQSTTGGFPRILQKPFNCTTGTGGGNICTTDANNTCTAGAQIVDDTTIAEQCFPGTYTVPVNFLFTNKIIRIHSSFETVTGASPPTITIRFYWGGTGGTAVMTTTAVAPGASATRWYEFCLQIQGTAAAGASVSIEFANCSGSAGIIGSYATGSHVVTTLATNASKAIVVTGQWTSNVANTHTIRQVQFYPEEIW
jgi:hypothetical protein